ncbi:unnamed protein product [Polarella glacialis]|uniref:Uncharacterized protein n=1 Tax=Polarella glacialis TaxID=89957 RepID=A0A813KGU8_POLGL|nr:unnamed protein product [Polarella glacialis]
MVAFANSRCNSFQSRRRLEILCSSLVAVLFISGEAAGPNNNNNNDLADTGGRYLSREVSLLREAGLEPAILQVTDVRQLRQTVDAETLQRRQVSPDSTRGPWTLDALLQGPANSSYDHHFAHIQPCSKT